MKNKSTKSSKLHLIIDGPDKVGKSTVIQLLAKELNLPVIKMKDMPKFFKKNPEEASEIFNKTVAQFKDSSFIMDRGFPSSVVYSYAYGRDYPLGYLDEIEDDLAPTIVILYRKTPRAKDDIVSDRMYVKIRRAYVSIAMELGWNLIDVGDLKPKEICKKILEII